jgi:OOP family OmpA-OmpF porin
MLRHLIAAVQKLFQVAQHAGYEVRLHIIGHTDKTGPERRNRQLSQARAERILALLASDDIGGIPVRAVAVGSREPLGEETTEADRKMNRMVTFRVLLTELPGR